MKIRCVWEHNGDDTLLHAADFPGAFTRGENLDVARRKMAKEIKAYAAWRALDIDRVDEVEIVQESACELEVRDADSDVLFRSESEPLTLVEYQRLKALACKSALDFFALYDSIPDKNRSVAPARKTFYGQAPRTAEDMYRHTKHVHAYYFGEIGVEAENDGSIFACRQRGFETLEKQEGFLSNLVREGSYGEMWSLRKVLRRFLWHDRIHAKAMYKMAAGIWGRATIPDVFAFDGWM